MPRLSTPRIAATFSVIPDPGTVVPGAPNTPTSPARALGAPHTTCTGSPAPVSTESRRNLSACGCGSAVTTRAIVKAFSAAPGSSTPSTSSPIAVSLATIVSSGASVSRCSFSQPKVNLMPPLPRRA